MTSASTAPVTAESLRADLERAIRSRHVAADPVAVAETALSVVLPHLKRMAGEIDRLRGLVRNSATTIDVLRGQVKDGSEGEERRA
jgi:hypothetical protein